MFKRILVPLDGTRHAEQAIPVAARLAKACDGTIVFVRIILPPVEFGTYSVDRTLELKHSAFESRIEEAAHYLTQVASVYVDDLAGIKTEMDLLSGAAAPRIFSAARLEAVDLIVMCSQGETHLRRWIFSSVAQEAVRHSPVPVLVLNEHGVLLPTKMDATHPLRILVTLDGSTLAEAVIEPVAALVEAWLDKGAHCELHLLRVVDFPSAYGKMKSQANITDSMQEEAKVEATEYIKATTQRLSARLAARKEFTITSSLVVNSDVAGSIVKIATGHENEGSYDLIAMATHGRTGLPRLVHGSVTEHVLGHSKLPLLVVRPYVTEGRKEEAFVTASEAQIWIKHVQ